MDTSASTFARHRRLAAAGACLLAATAAIGCGKKGPPLPPFAKAPAAVSELSVRRLGNRVEIRFTVPTVDVDGQRPARIDRVEVWALTGPATPAPLFLKYATLVGTVPVRRPPPPAPDVEEGKPPPPPPPPSTEPGLDQGQPGLVVDELTSDEFTPIAIPELDKQRAQDEAARAKLLQETGPIRLSPPDIGPPLPPPTTRHYVVLGRNGGRKGAMTPRVPVPLTPAAPAPPAPTVTVAENYVELTWTAPAGLRKPITKGTALPSPGSVATPGVAAPATPVAPAPTPPPAVPPAVDASGNPLPPPVLNSRSLTGFPVVTIGYNVYEVAPAHLTPAPAEPGAVPALPRKATPAPVAALTWRDEKIDFGAERCYVLRTVETSGASVVESEPSPVTCVSPTDTFPPKAPTSLAAVASEGAIGLIWDANTESDLAGYIVLRGEAPGTTMSPLMTSPIKETTYRDTTTKAGVRYVYAVVAVDMATPQNVSTQSNRVEETAR